MTIDHLTLEQLPEVAKRIVDVWKHPVLLLRGEMGAGKTTLTAALLKALGSSDLASSPTFSIVNEYLLESGGKLYHFDLYRLKSHHEAFEIGMEEYLHSGYRCVVEWPENFLTFMPAKVHEIFLENTGASRRLTFQTLAL
jgi:tRNA threonylcarbamoyladenosine biosynthesis protein TsaE